MNRTLRLIQNENMKLYKKRSTLIIIGFFLLFLGLGGILIHSQGNPPKDPNWKAELTQQNETLKNSEFLPPNQRQPLSEIKDQIALNNYQISHDIDPAPFMNQANFMTNLAGFVFLIEVFAIMTAGSVVSSEFNSGTVKLWLTRPVKRPILLLSKYLSQTAFLIGLFMGLFLVSILMGLVFYGISGWDLPFLYVQHGVVYAQHPFLHLLELYGLHFIEAIVIMTCAFMLSTITHNSAFTIGITLFLTLTKTLSASFESDLHWLKYYLFTNLNFTSQLWGGTSYNLTPVGAPFSFLIVVIYMIIFIFVTWFTFSKRDVTNA